MLGREGVLLLLRRKRIPVPARGNHLASLCWPTTTRWEAVTTALCLFLSVACVPELQPALPPGYGPGNQCSDGGQRISYDDAPDSLKTSPVEDAFLQYSTLAGQWSVDVLCPPDSLTTRLLEFSIGVLPLNDVEFLEMCDGNFAATTKCRIIFTGDGFPELAGQASDFDVLFSPGSGLCIGRLYPEVAYSCGPLEVDPSFNPEWDFLAVGFAVSSTNEVFVTIKYGFKPYRNSQGGMTQMGYDCHSESAVRTDP